VSVETTVVGSYPKPPDEGEGFALRQALHARERGEAGEADVRHAEDELVARNIGEQAAAGIDIVTDGHARWDDILTPFARRAAGFEIGGLLRWFANNVYYRRPVCVGSIEWRGPASVEGFAFAQSVSDRPVKAVIPGPVTFARLSVDEHYGSHETFVLAIARLLAQEAFELEAAGALHIQIDEPALLGAPEDVALAEQALGIVVSDLEAAETTIATYFGDAKRLGAELFDLPADCFGLDLVAGPENIELLHALPPGKKVQLGIVDARNTKLEEVDDLGDLLDRILGIVAADRLRVSPSAGLEFLPREKARAKLHRLSEVARKVGE
jgi:5-methyltetrahydropteroyltriglutamate--homocysteine methyltransferase